ncbi:MAG TPA: D-alanyl-D-alanine carboxypeptidase family protein, partial [bacterium]|nr:D-alanyl-D-alanine carboxypeptidase family protein [bacterium]
GLAVDLAALQRGRVVRGYAFGTSAAGRWVSQNAARYGFILRYPAGKEEITGIKTWSSSPAPTHCEFSPRPAKRSEK